LGLSYDATCDFAGIGRECASKCCDLESLISFADMCLGFHEIETRSSRLYEILFLNVASSCASFVAWLILQSNAIYLTSWRQMALEAATDFCSLFPLFNIGRFSLLNLQSSFSFVDAPVSLEKF